MSFDKDIYLCDYLSRCRTLSSTQKLVCCPSTISPLFPNQFPQSLTWVVTNFAFSKASYKWNYAVNVFCVYLLSLNLILLKLIYFIACISMYSFLWLSSITYKAIGLSIYQLINNLGVSSYTNKAVTNICIQVFVWSYVFISLK